MWSSFLALANLSIWSSFLALANLSMWSLLDRANLSIWSSFLANRSIWSSSTDRANLKRWSSLVSLANRSMWSLLSALANLNKWSSSVERANRRRWSSDHFFASSCKSEKYWILCQEKVTIKTCFLAKIEIKRKNRFILKLKPLFFITLHSNRKSKLMNKAIQLIKCR